ncbi:MAG: phosphopantothenoylcysteine decarboxylase [Firmicutes bacterium]|nr:phosphopantothenoylcysteine decarboxylase [Bacillota bacterium]
MKKRHIMLGITGGIAAYKACDIVNLLRKEGHSVQAVMTNAAQQFITPLTLQSLTGETVYTDADIFKLMEKVNIEHINVAQRADLALIAPATANTIGKIAGGIADDALSTSMVSLKSGTPRIIAPAMNTEIYNNPIVQDNIEKLKQYGFKFVGPREGMLACGDRGIGVIEHPKAIVQSVLEELEKLD